MADQYGLFWNSISGDRIYDADSFAEWLNKFFTTGVFNGELQVVPDSGMVVDVTSGYANINGKVKFFEQTQSFTIGTASGVYPRIDTIVIRCDTGNRIITTEYVRGEYSGLNPVPTAPVRSGGIYEIVLAEIYVSAGATQILVNDITDKRSDDSVCGWVTSTVEGVPMDQIVSQMQAQFMTWFDHMKDQLDEDAAGHLQMEIDTLSDAVEAHDIDLGIRETGTTASQMHRAGQYFMLDHRFCVATQNIAEGDTLEHLVNYKYANVGDELYELKAGLTNNVTFTPTVSSSITDLQIRTCTGTYNPATKLVVIRMMLYSPSGNIPVAGGVIARIPAEYAPPVKVESIANVIPNVSGFTDVRVESLITSNDGSIYLGNYIYGNVATKWIGAIIVYFAK